MFILECIFGFVLAVVLGYIELEKIALRVLGVTVSSKK